MLAVAEKLKKIYGGEVLFSGVSFTIEEKDRIGLVGANGAGKSTLLNLLTGRETPDEGTVSLKSGLRYGFLQQNAGLTGGNTIEEEMRSVFQPLLDMKAELDVLAGRMEAEPENTKLSSRYAQLLTAFEAGEGYLIDVKIATVLGGMGFADKRRDTVIDTLSGGERTRLAVCKLLLEEPELLLLDEPTNHLDFKTLGWLEDYLLSYRGAVLIVSHDRYFLDKCVTKIFDMELGSMQVYKGNYSKYTVLKEEQFERRRKEYEAQQKQIAAMREYAEKNITRASTSGMAKSRLKALDRMEVLDRPMTDRRTAGIRFTYRTEPVKEVLAIEGLELAVGEGSRRKVLLENLDLTVLRGEKIGIIGENGVGKSTLLKMILGRLPHEKGKIRVGGGVQFGYFDQHGEQLNPRNTALEELWGRFPRMSETEVRTALGRMLLTGDDVYKQVGVLSGGERAKLSFAILSLQQPNVMLLDEPTNHLDLRSKEVLEQALCAFTGTLLMVTHDRYLLNRVPTAILELERDGACLYKGNYDRYAAQRVKPDKPAAAEQRQTKPSTGGNYRSKEERRRQVQLRQQLAELERSVAEAEQAAALVEQELLDPKVYSDYTLLEEKTRELERHRAQAEELFAQWAQLSEQI